jgi:hypothetical protein
MAVKAERVSVGTTATLVSGTDAFPYLESDRALDVAIRPVGDIYIGGSDVTTATGFLVKADEVYGQELLSGEQLYAVAASTTEVHVIRGGV